MNSPKYISVDELQAQTSLEEAAAICGVTLKAHGSGKEVRLDCLFGCPGDHAGKREIAVNTDNPQKIFLCHAYICQFRGNLLSLMHGMLTGSKPTGGKLIGNEFTRIRNLLAGTLQQANAPQPTTAPHPSPDTAPLIRNLPLADSDNPKARELVHLHERLIVDVAAMPPPAARYARAHPCLTSPELLLKWHVGVLPTGATTSAAGPSAARSCIPS